jgi:hypothetical protein
MPLKDQAHLIAILAAAVKEKKPIFPLQRLRKSAFFLTLKLGKLPP